MKKMLLTAAVLLPLFTTSAFACGADTDCPIGENRIYRIAMPENANSDSPLGAIVFAHGYRGTASGLMKNKSLRRVVSDLGLAFVAPKSLRGDWDIPYAPSLGIDNKGDYTELAYFDALKKQLVEKHNVDPNRIMITGFSAGGMMTWNLACDRGSAFAAFAPISGTFWGKVTADKKCPDMGRHIIHMHGTKDTVVPIKGRPIARSIQGDVRMALAMAAKQLDLGLPKKMKREFNLSCRMRESNSGKGLLQTCYHPGGHSLQSAWIGRAWREFEKAGAFDK